MASTRFQWPKAVARSSKQPSSQDRGMSALMSVFLERLNERLASPPRARLGTAAIKPLV